IHCSRPHRALHSFPTRRSSDLTWQGGFDDPEPAALLRGLRTAPAIDPWRPELFYALLFMLGVVGAYVVSARLAARGQTGVDALRSEEHTSELQSRFDLVCRLLL